MSFQQQDRAPPSVAALAIGFTVIGAITGYYLGEARSLGLFTFGRSPTSNHSSAAAAHPDDDSDDSDDDDSVALSEDEAHDLGELKQFRDNTEECKLVLVVRNDLGMGKGKIAAQCSHATLACYKAMLRADPAHPLLRQWEKLGQAKVALKVDNEDEMLLLQAQAVSFGLCARVIHDAGRTQIASGSATVLGIGPAPKSKIDEVTGHLRLL